MRKGLMVLILSIPFLFVTAWADTVEKWVVPPYLKKGNKFSVSDMAVGNDGKVWFIWAKAVYQWDSKSNTPEKLILFGGKKDPIRLNKKTGQLTTYNNRKLIALDSQKLDSLTGIASRIAIDTKGRPWVVTTTKKLYRFDGKYWTLMPGKLSDIAIGVNGDVWGLSHKSASKAPGYSVMKFEGTSWEKSSMVANLGQLVVDGSGEAWVISRQDAPPNKYNIFRSQNGNWKKMPELLLPILIASDHKGNIWVKSRDRKYNMHHVIYKWTQSDWQDTYHVAASGPLVFSQKGNPMFPSLYIPDGNTPLKKAKGLAITPNLLVSSFTIDNNDTIWVIRNSKQNRNAGQASEILKWDGKKLTAGIPTSKRGQTGDNLNAQEKMTEVLRGIAFDQSGSAWVLGADYHLYRRENNTWLKKDDRRLLNIVSSPKGVIWAIDESPKVRTKRARSPSFGFGHQVYRWQGSKLKAIGKEQWFIYNLAIDNNGAPWITARDTSIKSKRKQIVVYRLENENWIKVPIPDEFNATAKLGGSVDGSIFLGAMKEKQPVLLKWTGKQWKKYSGWYLSDQIAADSKGKPWALFQGGLVTTDLNSNLKKTNKILPTKKPDKKIYTEKKYKPVKKAPVVDKLVGCWNWSNGSKIVVNKDGSVRNGDIGATWKSINQSKGEYSITWPSFVDLLSFTNNGNQLNGVNNLGFPISATRKSGDTSGLIGTWLWSSNTTVKINSDKTVTAGHLKGLWHRTGKNWAIEWPLIDNIVMAKNGLSLTVKNQFGAVTAKRDVNCLNKNP